MVRVSIDSGARDYQIFQQTDGYAQITLSGRFKALEEYDETVYISVRREDSSEIVIWWEACQMTDDKWSHTLKIPAGGLYIIETCIGSNPEYLEWSGPGECIRHIGVGDIFIIAGQSNAAGYGKDFITDPSEPGVHILNNCHNWEIAQHPLQNNSFGQDTPNMDNAITGHSLYLSFAKYMKKELNYPIGLIQTAQGGAGLDLWNPQKGGKLYDNMLEMINLAGGKVSGMIWYQGCTDTAVDLCDTYYERFLEMKSRLEKDIDMPDMPIILIQLARCVEKSDNEKDIRWGKIRDALRRLGHNKNMYTIPAIDSTLSDHIHVSSLSCIVLGERCAKSMLTHFYGKSFFCNAPDISSAKKISDNEVLLSFDNVYYKLCVDIFSPDTVAISVFDDEGENKLTEISGKFNKITLYCERPVKKGSVVHGAWDEGVYKNVPVDFATHLPMLSFYNFKIEE